MHLAALKLDALRSGANEKDPCKLHGPHPPVLNPISSLFFVRYSVGLQDTSALRAAMLHLTRAPNGAIFAISPILLCNACPKPHLFSLPKRSKLCSRKTHLTISNSESNPTQAALLDPPPSQSLASPLPTNEQGFVSIEQDNVPLEGVIQMEKPASSSSSPKSWARITLFASGDVVALLMFTAIGRFSHGFPVLDVETLHTADPFIAGIITDECMCVTTRILGPTPCACLAKS